MVSRTLPRADLEHILDHTGPLWQQLRGCRLFVTGGTGFFGKWLLETILAANDQLHSQVSATVLCRNPEAFLAQMPHLTQRREFEWLKGDVRDFSFPETLHDYVLHMATAASAQLNDAHPLAMLDTIVAGTRHVLDFARHCGAQRLLLTSSGAIYGQQPPDLSHIPETYSSGPDPLAPASAYAEGKRMAELLCALTPTVPCVIARCFAFIGPHLPLDTHFAAGNFLRDAMHGSPIHVRGDGTSVRSYLYAADLIVWLLTLLLKGKPGRAYNVGSEEAISIGQLAQRISALAGGSSAVSIDGMPSTAPTHRYVPATGRCKAELGLKPTIGLDQAITATLRWLREP